MIRIIGIGSPFGDDRAGLEVAGRMAAAAAPGVEVIVADRPGIDLVGMLRGADAVILIDAVRSDAPAGAVHDVDLHALPALRWTSVSSHGVGVAEAVALAWALSRRPSRGRLVGIEAAAAAPEMSAALSPAVARSIDEVVQRVHAWVDYFHAIPRSDEEDDARA
jgi:hydrogenase maturation protease